MKPLAILMLLLAFVGCDESQSYYQYNEISNISVYEKGKNELYLEIYSGDSFTSMNNPEVIEKEERIVFRVPYTLSESKSDYFRNKEGNHIQLILTDGALTKKEVFYQDGSGMHKMDIKEWHDDLLEPYVLPEGADPFESSNAEPVGRLNSFRAPRYSLETPHRSRKRLTGCL